VLGVTATSKLTVQPMGSSSTMVGSELEIKVVGSAQ
jgi:hypothetical protein